MNKSAAFPDCCGGRIKQPSYEKTNQEIYLNQHLADHNRSDRICILTIKKGGGGKNKDFGGMRYVQRPD